MARLSDRSVATDVLANRIWQLRSNYQLIGDLLVTYLVASGRALYVGINRFEPGLLPGAVRWQFFAKLSYAVLL